MSQRRGSDDSSRQPGDGDLPELPAEFVVPDDPRELAAEAEAVRAQLWAEERERTSDGRQRSGLSGPLIGLVLMLVAAIGSLVIVALPYTPSRPVRAPLAAPGTVVGHQGGLLPDVRLTDDQGRPVAVRDVRPAVVLLMPAGCGCDDVAADLVRISQGALISVQLVGADAPPELPPGAARDRVFALTDSSGALTSAVAGGLAGRASAHPSALDAGPIAVLVRANGVIAAVVPGLRDARLLRADLASLAIT